MKSNISYDRILSTNKFTHTYVVHIMYLLSSDNLFGCFKICSISIMLKGNIKDTLQMLQVYSL